MTEDEMVGWHHWLNGHQSDQPSGDDEGQGSLAYCSPWGCRVRHTWVTEQQQWTVAHHAPLASTISWSLFKFSTESVMPSNHLILCCFLLLLPSISPSIKSLFRESALCIRWPKYWSFSFSISPSNEHPGLISFRIDWFDLLAIQRTLKSLFQHHNLKVSVLRCSDFFMVQFSHPYTITGKTIALTIQTFVSQMMSLLFNTLSRFVKAFLPRSKLLNFMTAVTIHSDFGAQENKICHCFHFSPSTCHEVMGDGMPWS